MPFARDAGPGNSIASMRKSSTRSALAVRSFDARPALAAALMAFQSARSASVGYTPVSMRRRTAIGAATALQACDFALEVDPPTNLDVESGHDDCGGGPPYYPPPPSGCDKALLLKAQVRMSRASTRPGDWRPQTSPHATLREQLRMNPPIGLFYNPII